MAAVDGVRFSAEQFARNSASSVDPDGCLFYAVTGDKHDTTIQARGADEELLRSGEAPKPGAVSIF
jgi:hypothetical protein